MHPALEAIRAVTQGTPWEGELWLVGGAVRDELLGLPIEADFDLVLRGKSAELADHLYRGKVARYKPVIYERFGTVRLETNDAVIELVTARKESYEERSRKPEVEPATLEEDALRRDFTVNTLLRNLHTRELRDPTGLGKADLDAKVLRTPLDPAETFHDDPLRMLRAIRFRWKLGFQPADGLYDAILTEAHRLKIISGERIRDEMVKMLLHPAAAEALSDLMSLDLLPQFWPELKLLVGLDQPAPHYQDAWSHTLEVVRRVSEDDLVLPLAALLHDVGKPSTLTEADGRRTFRRHAEEGAALAEAMLRRLRFSREEIHSVSLLVRAHSRVSKGRTTPDGELRRLVVDLGDDLERLLDLVEADTHATSQPVDLEQIRTRIHVILDATPRESLTSPLEGQEIMDLLQIEPGPEVGHWKKLLTERVLDGELSPGDKVKAREMLLRLNTERR